MIPLKPCTKKSSLIAEYGYEPSTSTLAVRFVSGGRTYLYRDVPPDVAEGLASADSPGAYFGANIRKVFEFEPVMAGDEAGRRNG